MYWDEEFHVGLGTRYCQCEPIELVFDGPVCVPRQGTGEFGYGHVGDESNYYDGNETEGYAGNQFRVFWVPAVGDGVEGLPVTRDMINQRSRSLGAQSVLIFKLHFDGSSATGQHTGGKSDFELRYEITQPGHARFVDLRLKLSALVRTAAMIEIVSFKNRRIEMAKERPLLPEEEAYLAFLMPLILS